jgi:hypothetical protein
MSNEKCITVCKHITLLVVCKEIQAALKPSVVPETHLTEAVRHETAEKQLQKVA